MKKALLTGITGQDGAYLAKLLLSKDYKVYGLVRRIVNRNFSNLEYLGVDKEVEYVDGDLTDEASLIKVIKTISPDEVYNLGAQSFVGTSWDQPLVTAEVNAIGTLKLLNAIKNNWPTAKYYQASTSEMFGNSQTSGNQDENTPFHPRSPYAIAKLFAYWSTVNYKESFGMFCANGILFNHESPIRGLEFVSRKITDGVARIKLGLAQDIKLGNLESQRDWGFAGDYVEAMWLMLQAKEADDFVVATGQTHSIKDFLDLSFRHVGIKDWEQYVKIDPRFKRPAELHALRGDCSKVKKVLGWRPKINFEELVAMMMEADLQRLKNK